MATRTKNPLFLSLEGLAANPAERREEQVKNWSE